MNVKKKDNAICGDFVALTLCSVGFIFIFSALSPHLLHLVVALCSLSQAPMSYYYILRICKLKQLDGVCFWWKNTNHCRHDTFLIFLMNVMLQKEEGLMTGRNELFSTERLGGFSLHCPEWRHSSTNLSQPAHRWISQDSAACWGPSEAAETVFKWPEEVWAEVEEIFRSLNLIWNMSTLKCLKPTLCCFVLFSCFLLSADCKTNCPSGIIKFTLTLTLRS